MRISDDKRQVAFRRLDHFFGSPAAQKKGFPSEDAAANSAATLLAGQMKLKYGTAIEIVKAWYQRGGVAETRRTARETTPDAEAAGANYAEAQIGGDYFMDWVREQMLEASQADPAQQLPLETKEDARVIAKNMLQQLRWDAERGLEPREIANLIETDSTTHNDIKEFWSGFRQVENESRDWLADELLTIKGEMGESRASEMRASRRRQPEKIPHGSRDGFYAPEDAVAYAQSVAPEGAKIVVTKTPSKIYPPGYYKVEWGPPLSEPHRPKAVGSVRRLEERKLGTMQRRVLEAVRDHGEFYPPDADYETSERMKTVGRKLIHSGLIGILSYAHPELVSGRSKQLYLTLDGQAALGREEPRSASSPIDPSNIKTRAVAGAAYKSNDIRSTLTHAVDQTTDKPLCNRVKPENILDDSYAVDENAPATCPLCAKRDPRFN